MNNYSLSRIGMLFFVAAWLLFALGVSGEEDAHDEQAEESGALVMSAAERNAAGVETGVVGRSAVAGQLRLPGEVLPNAYKSAKVAPRVTAQVVKRRVQLGEPVKAGQPMVTLSSIEMADAQGELLVANQEWQRVSALGPEVVSGRRYTEAQVGRQRAMAKVLAFGMTESQAKKLLDVGDASKANGEFDVLAPLSGTVLMDDFLVGEILEPGRVIFEISDESTLWIEARTAAGNMPGMAVGMPVRISPDGNQWREATVVQIHHRLDEITRTQGIRVEFSNEDDWLHSGQFVEVEIAAGSPIEVLAVPAESVVLLKGATVIFRLEAGAEFHPEPVTAGATYGDSREILSGLKVGDVIATKGTFFLKSLALKSELSGGHGH